MSIVFNQTALEAWIALCNEEGRLKNEGASAEVLETMRIRVAKALVALIQESQAESLLQQILYGQPKTEVTTVEDPTS
jgi:hypothetical protein